MENHEWDIQGRVNMMPPLMAPRTAGSDDDDDADLTLPADDPSEDVADSAPRPAAAAVAPSAFLENPAAFVGRRAGEDLDVVSPGPARPVRADGRDSDEGRDSGEVGPLRLLGVATSNCRQSQPSPYTASQSATTATVLIFPSWHRHHGTAIMASSRLTCWRCSGTAGSCASPVLRQASPSGGA
jgi:hypothetical protein